MVFDSDNILEIKEKIKKLFSKEKSVMQKYNLIQAYVQFKVRKLFLYNYPIRLTIDPCNYCNLHCTMCPTGTNAKGRKQSFMSFDTFKKIIDECGPFLWEIYLYNWGEPLLNKDIFKMVRYARQMRIDVTVSTNLNHFNDNICNNLIKSGLNKLIISLYGASQESVEKYQEGNNLELVIKNVKQIVYMKEKLKSNSPFIQWRFMVNKYNEDEIEKAKELSKRLKIDKLELGFFRCDMAKEVFLNSEAQYENVKAWLPNNEKLSMYDYSQKRKKNNKNVCRLLWFESVIQPDGSISPCCAVWTEKFDFGNISHSSFRQIWNNKIYQSARRINRGDNFSFNEHICYICKLNNAQI